MKSFFLFIFVLILSYNSFSQQQIPNGNFEIWTNNEAVPWSSTVNILGNDISLATQTGDALQGSAAAKLENQLIFGQFVPGLITLGEIDITNMTISGGIPFTDRPAGISYFFKYAPVNSDSSFMIADLTKWNDVSNKADTIAFTAYFSSYVTTEYTQVGMPFLYNSDEIPDTLNIIFSASGFSGNAGSILTIDSVAAEYGNITAPTICFSAKNITSDQFTANWLTMPNAVSYSIDVSENSDFTTFVSGYENLNTIDTFYSVNASSGTYYYRVRVNYDGATSINSNTIEVLLENTGIKEFNSEEIKIKSISNLISIETSKLNLDYIEIYNIEGQLIKIINISGNKAEFSLPTSGMYVFKIHSGNKAISKKVNVIF